MPGDGELTGERYRRGFRTVCRTRLLVGVVVEVLVGVSGEWVFAPVAGGAGAAAVFDLGVWLSNTHMDANQTTIDATWKIFQCSQVAADPTITTSDHPTRQLRRWWDGGLGRSGALCLTTGARARGWETLRPEWAVPDPADI